VRSSSSRMMMSRVSSGSGSGRRANFGPRFRAPVTMSGRALMIGHDADAQHPRDIGMTPAHIHHSPGLTGDLVGRMPLSRQRALPPPFVRRCASSHVLRDYARESWMLAQFSLSQLAKDNPPQPQATPILDPSRSLPMTIDQYNGGGLPLVTSRSTVILCASA
jgi:hypothetical protein